eukprot:m.312802 g.312802  ORF g.312802 m.312802 type:complete len:385 (-) comp55400_c0_seq1:62-1216(-)
MALSTERTIQISCMCMNVKLRVPHQQIDIANVLEFSRPSEQPRESLFIQSYHLKDLHSETIVHPLLCERSLVSHEGHEWNIRRCSICNREIFATAGSSPGLTRILVNQTTVVIGEDAIQKGKLHHWYSELFQVIIPQQRDAAPSAQYASLNSRVKSELEAYKKQALELAEERMEAEIKALKEKFERLKQSSLDEELALMRAVVSMQLVRDRSQSIPLQTETRPRGQRATPDCSPFPQQARFGPPVSSPSMSAQITPGKSKPVTPAKSATQSDFDDTFALEDIIGGGRPLGATQSSSRSESDDDDDDDDLSDAQSGRYDARLQVPMASSFVAGSLPIPISKTPSQHQFKHRSSSNHTSDGAASIQENALRLHTTSDDDVMVGSPQ